MAGKETMSIGLGYAQERVQKSLVNLLRQVIRESVQYQFFDFTDRGAFAKFDLVQWFSCHWASYSLLDVAYRVMDGCIGR